MNTNTTTDENVENAKLILEVLKSTLEGCQYPSIQKLSSAVESILPLIEDGDVESAITEAHSLLSIFNKFQIFSMAHVVDNVIENLVRVK